MGGLRSLLPLLENPRNLDVHWYGREPALGYLRERGHRAEHLEKIGQSSRNCDVLLTDTINLSRTNEGLLCREAWLFAAKAKVPSVAFVDCWWGYLQRFTLPGERLTDVHLPDVIAVVDDIARADMVSLGFPEDRLHVLGSPWLSYLAHARGKEAGERYRMATDEIILGFVSQPLARVLNDRDAWGFTELDVIPALVRACTVLPRETRDKLRLVILAHPEEDEVELACLLNELSPSFRVELHKEIDPLALVRTCDAVTGMFSMLLIEAMLCGLPVVSLQPALKREDMLVTNRVGATRAVREMAQIQHVVRRLLCDETYRAELIRDYSLFRVVRESNASWRQLLDILVDKSGLGAFRCQDERR